ncbi:MAG TPA: asparagine synthase (glutamine-hydrolyzing) [Burkholderiales bacterium]
MGGIAGWITPARNAPDPAAVVPALEALAHRGASGEGIYVAHSESGHQVVLAQPHCDDADNAVVLDGTIVNHDDLKTQLALRGFAPSEGGTRVLLDAYEQWDKDVVHHLRGAFAFALWDAGRERLLLARDRFGEKPLYLCERDGALYFASEIRALLKMPGVAALADPRAVHDYLAYRYVPAPRTLISGVRKLMPGTYALWQFGRLREVRYWSSPDRTPHAGQPVADAVGAFTEKLSESIRVRSEGAGVLLSGGVDSAALVALAAKNGARPKTFSAGFADDPQSELPRASAIAKQFGTDHHEIVLSPHDVVAALEYSVIQRDAPLSRPADVALHLIARHAARHVSAVLTGDGGDELLGGYRRHVAERHGWWFRGVPTLLFLAAPLARSRPELQTAFDSLRTSDSRKRLVRWIGAAGSHEIGDLLGEKTDLPPFDADPRASSLRQALYFDQASWLPDNVLERGDRVAMAESLETRAPFLDHKLAELVSALPDHARVHGLETKWILRQALKPLLGELKPRKGGWRVPVGAWLRGELREYLLDNLRGGGSMTRCYYEPKALDRLIDDHLAGRRNHETVLWTLLNLEIWHRTCLRA